MWAGGIGGEWYPYATLLWAALALASRPLWASRNIRLARAGWIYAAVLAVSPVFFTEAFGSTWHAAATFGAAAVILATIAWLDSEGRTALTGAGERTPFGERASFGWLAAAFALASLAATQRTLEVAVPNTGWAFLAVTLAVAAAMALPRFRTNKALWFLLPISLSSIVVSGQENHPGHNAVITGVPAAFYLLLFLVTSRWTFAVVSTALAALAAALLWSATGSPTWSLAITYSAVGLLLFAALTPLRRTYGETWGPPIVLSWGPVLLGLVTAAVALIRATVDEPDLDVQNREYDTLTALIMLLAPLIAFEGLRLRQSGSLIAAAAIAAFATFMAWAALDYPLWTLAIMYSAVGVLLFAVLLPRRRTYDHRDLNWLILSWGLPLLGVITAWGAIGNRLDREPSLIAVDTVEYRTLTILVLLLAPLVSFESMRLHRLGYLILSSAIAMTALLMTVAMAQPGNVQAYTIPVGVYFLAIGLIIRHSGPVIAANLMQHEVALIVGAALLVLPQAEQSFEPNGAYWGLALIGEGLIFLLVALLLRARWLLVAGVLTLSGVAVRWLFESSDVVPFWLLLGVTGTALLLFAVWILAKRESWERLRLGASRWWQERTASAP